MIDVLAFQNQLVTLTGTTVETPMAVVTVPGNTLGPSGVLRILFGFDCNNNANAKVWRLYFGGQQVSAFNLATSGGNTGRPSNGFDGRIILVVDPVDALVSKARVPLPWYGTRLTMTLCWSGSARMGACAAGGCDPRSRLPFSGATKVPWPVGWNSVGSVSAGRAVPHRPRIWNTRQPRSRGSENWKHGACLTALICPIASRICLWITATRARLKS